MSAISNPASTNWWGLTSGALIQGGAALTMVIWVKANNTGIDRGFIRTYTASTQDRRVGCRYDAGNRCGANALKLSIDAAKSNDGYESAINKQSTSLQCVIFSWAATGQEELWLNGVLDSPCYRAAAYGGTVSACTVLHINRGPQDNTTSWDGEVYEVRAYNRKLTAIECENIGTRMLGQDAIKNGLIFKWHPNQSYPGQNLSTGIIDRSGNGNTTDYVSAAAPTYGVDLVRTRRRRAA